MQKEFQGFLSRFNTKSKDEKIIKEFSIKSEEITENPTFLFNFEKVTGYDNVSSLFNTPIRWNNLVIPDLREVFKIEFDLLADPIECVLRTIKVRKGYRKACEVFTYEFQFTKEVEPELDSVFESYLNQKEEDENGRKKTMLFPIVAERTGTEEVANKVTDEEDSGVKEVEFN